MNSKIQAKDLINLGLFTVIYFVLGCCVAIPIGMVTLMAVLSGLLMGFTGMGFFGVPCGLVHIFQCILWLSSQEQILQASSVKSTLIR